MITKQTMEQLRKEIDAHLVMVGVKHNLKLQLGNGRYQLAGDSGHFKLNIVDLSNQNGAQTMEELDFKRHALKLGLNPDWLHKQYDSTFDGKMYEIVGLKPRRWKRPVVVQDVITGKRFIETPSFIIKNMG